MHGTGLLMAMSTMLSGGCVITLNHHSFNAHEMWAAAQKHKAMTLVIVGDAFAKPMLAALDEQPGRYDTSSIVNMVSSGVMWSREVKQALLEHIPQAILVDSFGSSEAVGFGTSMMTKDGEVQTAKFQIGDRCKVFDENDQLVEPGSGKPRHHRDARRPFRSATTRTRRRPPRPSRPSTACATPCPATGAWWRRTAR